MSEQEQKPEQAEVEGHATKWGRNEEPVTEPEDKAEEERKEREPDVEAHGGRMG